MTSHSVKTLFALLNGVCAGRVEQDRKGKLSFSYETDWQTHEDAYPLSLSMPLAISEHSDEIVRAYLWGLLPDNEVTLSEWGRKFKASARNPFSLLCHTGEDCQGAVQFVDAPASRGVGESQDRVEWITHQDVGARLREVVRDVGNTRRLDDIGQFSLAGAQPKIALAYHPKQKQWGVPQGRYPTTHILKPPGVGSRPNIAINEHFCLSLARNVGLPAAYSTVEVFDGQVTIVVERFDRTEQNPPQRVHQEDMCQALGKSPDKKSQNDGGPTPQDIAKILESYSDEPEEDISNFVKALALNWVIGGTDAHAKNYSILHAAQGAMRLAPLYDVASILPYEKKMLSKCKLAMKIGDEYRLTRLKRNHWAQFLGEAPFQNRLLLNDIADFISKIPQAVADTRAHASNKNLDNRFLDEISELIHARAIRCYEMLCQRPADVIVV